MKQGFGVSLSNAESEKGGEEKKKNPSDEPFKPRQSL